MAYKAGELIGPFWAKNSGVANGRDPLGIQNSSVATYVKLLPGLTNVTTHIRYYGFYCWLIDQYIRDKSVKDNNSLRQQLFYIRKAELLLAYIIKDNEEPGKPYNGVGGSTYATNELNSSSKAIINLQEGARFFREAKTKVYWKLSSGVFGQYYVGVLKDLGLLIDRGQGNNIYLPTKEGSLLAEEFDKNLLPRQKKIFLDCIHDGKVNRSDLKHLLSFHLNGIGYGTGEWKFYVDLLKGPDKIADGKAGMTGFRKSTIQLYLNWVKENSELDFQTSVFMRKGVMANKEISEAARGWFYYDLNEFVHLAYEYIFCSLLYSMDVFPKDLKQLVNGLTEEAYSEFRRLYKVGKKMPEQLSHLNDSIDHNVLDLYLEMAESYKGKNYPETIARSIFLLVNLERQNSNEFAELQVFAKLWSIDRPGNAVDLLRELVTENLTKDLRKVTGEIIYRSINDHLYSSYSKAALNQRDVLNLLIEENDVRRLRDISPSPTSPRVSMLRNFLLDLNILSAEGKLKAGAIKIFE